MENEKDVFRDFSILDSDERAEEGLGDE